MVMRLAAVMHRPKLLSSACLALAVLALLLTLAIVRILAVPEPLPVLTLPAVSDPAPVVVPVPVAPAPEADTGWAYEPAEHSEGIYPVVPRASDGEFAEPEGQRGMTGIGYTRQGE